MRYTFPALIAVCLLTACGDPETPPPQDSDAITDAESLVRAFGGAFLKQACRARYQCAAIKDFREMDRYGDEASCLGAASELLDTSELGSLSTSEAAGRLTFNLDEAAACLTAASAALDALPPCMLESDRLEAALIPCLFKKQGHVAEGQRCYNSEECDEGDGEWAYCNADELPTCYETSLCVVVRRDPACAACGAEEDCIDGACVPRGEAGEPCLGYSCAEGLGCRDVAPADAEQQQGACTPYGSLKAGEGCRQLGAIYELCEPGLRCVYGQQGQPRCAAPIVAQRGEPCPDYDAGRCAPGLVCASDDRCAAPLAANAPCNSTQQCAAGLACIPPNDGVLEGTCQPLKAEGAPCLSDDECRPGLGCDSIDDTNQRCAPLAPFSCGS